jgi:aryl-alcohol dehydrogenase-like predicted oxidoreductase
MIKRLLGNSSVEVSPLVLGGNVFGWTVDEPTSFEILDHFVDHGFNCIDTADVYSRWVPGNVGGESETILGNWFARSGKRDQVVLATKVGMDLGDGKKGLKAGYIEQAVEASLKRLKTDYIDLYQAHIDDQETPLEETLSAFDKLIKAGKVRMIGASNYKGPRLAKALNISSSSGISAYVTLQPNYNLHTRAEYEKELAPVVHQYGLSVIPYYSLGSGFLTGKYKSKEDVKGKSRERTLGGYFDERGEKILVALSKVATGHNGNEASVALAWLLAQPHITGPIASATSIDQLQSLFAAVELILTTSDLQILNDASAY